VVVPIAAEIEAIGVASGSSDPGREASYSATPIDAGPGFPRHAPSVRMMYARGGKATPAS
jgi:hypothetical protein